MSTLELIESKVSELSVTEILELQDWINEYLEDHAALSPEFIASIDRGLADLEQGHTRAVKAS
jgi:PHD/YefM family antitoxin component YafN of YafNO toxin-antitoxin module